MSFAEPKATHCTSTSCCGQTIKTILWQDDSGSVQQTKLLIPFACLDEDAYMCNFWWKLQAAASHKDEPI
eukprot:4858994-Amphidinium_carterae.1